MRTLRLAKPSSATLPMRVMSKDIVAGYIALFAPGADGEGEDALLGEKGEGVMIALGDGLGPIEGLVGLEEEIGGAGGVLWIRDIEEGDLETGFPAVFVGILADADDALAGDGLEVGRVSGDFQLAGNFWLEGIAQIDDEERVFAVEGDEIAAIAVEARRADVFGESQAGE